MTQRSRFLWLGILLPLWLTAGRAALGSGGWGTFMLLLPGLPIILGPLAVTLIYTTRADVAHSGKLPNSEAGLLYFIYGALTISGFFLLDGGDIGESYSVFTRWFAPKQGELSGTISFASGSLGILANLFALVDAIRSRRR